MAPSSGSRQDRRLIHREGALGGAVAAALVVLGLALLVVNRFPPLLDLDKAIEDPVHRWALRTPLAVSVSETLSLVGGTLMSTVATLIVLAALLLARKWWVALAFGAVATFAPLITDVIKPVVARPRPVWVVPVVPEPPEFSFPSGHATGGIAVWLAAGLALAVLLRTHTAKAWFVLPWVLLGFSIGVSRVVLGVHWSSDVLAGWCVAAAVGGLAASLFVLPSSRTPVAPPKGALPTAVRSAAPPGAPAPDVPAVDVPVPDVPAADAGPAGRDTGMA